MSLDPADTLNEKQGFYLMTAGFLLVLVTFLLIFSRPEGEETWGVMTGIIGSIGTFSMLFGSEAVGVESGQNLLRWSTSILIGGIVAVLALELGYFQSGLTHFGSRHLTTFDIGMALIDTAIITGLFGVVQDARRWAGEEVIGDPEEDVDLDEDEGWR